MPLQSKQHIHLSMVGEASTAFKIARAVASLNGGSAAWGDRWTRIGQGWPLFLAWRENRRHFIDDVRISGAGDPYVPFQAADLGRMSKVRGSDVGRREAGLPVEEPCLGMQPRVVRVEGDPDIGPGFTQFIESARFRGSGIGCCQDSKRPTRRTVTLKTFQ